MADQQYIAPPDMAPPVPNQQQSPPQQAGGQPVPSATKALYDQLNKSQLYTKTFDDFQKQFSTPDAIDKLYQNLNGAKLYTKDKGAFYDQFFPSAKPASPTPASNQTTGTQTPAAAAEHEISHTPVQDIRHLNDLANQPMRSTVTSGGEGAPGVAIPNQEDVARNKAYQGQYQKGIGDLATAWGTDPKATQRAFEDFPGEMDENKLKSFATLNQQNPVYYGRLKNADDIRQAIAQSGPEGINDANIFNHLQTAPDYATLQHNIAMQQELMSKHGLGQQYFEKLKESQAPLVNTLDPGLLSQYWNSDDRKLGLSDFQYAGLETEKLFQPGKYQQDIAIIRHNRGLDQSGTGEPNPIPQGKEGYAYDRGVENVLFALENQGRQNTGQYINQRSAEIGPQIGQTLQKFQDWMKSTTDPILQQHFQQEFLSDPLHQEAARLYEGQQAIDYARTEDQRKFPLNYSDRATREVKDAMSHLNGVQGAANTESAVVKGLVLGAGQQGDNTMRFIKNTWINLLGSDQWKAENAASNIGHEALTDLAGYQGDAFSMHQNATVIDPELQAGVQHIFDDHSIDYQTKVERATNLIVSNPNQVKANPNAGQQNLTGKSVAFNTANTIGQILGIADQSLLMGGLLGDVSKAQQMANAFVPMYASTQNSLYEQALARGDEKPLLSSHLDAAIISLASLINPDAKVVKGMVGAETGIGKLIAGVDESTWNKVLSTNRPLVDRMIAGTKATAKQLGLANLQYGLIVPTAQYVVHKNVLNEDPNLGDAIKDGLLQTSISMALPALLHGAFGVKNAADINPMQKYALVEAGLHPKENIELIDQLVEKGQVTPDRADQIKAIIKHADHILENTEGVKSDGSMMNEQEVSDLTYQLLRKKVLEGKLKNAPAPQQPAIEQRINEIDRSVAELHTSEADKQKTALSDLLTSNIERIKSNMPAFEGAVREAVKRNEPEEVFKMIHDQASETTNVDGKEVSARAKTEEVFGKKLVDKAYELHNNKTTNNGERTNNAGRPDQAQEIGAYGTPSPKEGAASETTPQENAAPSFIHPTEVFRTWNLGDMEGKPEDEAAKKHLEGVVRQWDEHPAGETGGEPFGDFVSRVIPAFDKVLKEGANNTTIVTHSSVLKAMRVWDEMGRPDVEHLTEEQKKEFAEKYNATETHNGDLETFKGNNGDIHVIRHGQTVDNEKNNFRSGDTPLTHKGIGDAQAVGQELQAKTGGDVPQIITSDLPRTIHSSNIIHDALQERGPEGVLQRPPEGIGEAGGERQGVEPGQQGETPTGESGGPGEGREPPGGTAGQKVVSGKAPSQTGIAERVKKEREKAAGVKAPDPGTGLSVEEGIKRGRQMLKEGADPEKPMEAYDKNKSITADGVGLVRAQLEKLAKATDAAIEKYGGESDEANSAREAESDWAARIQPMQTEWAEIGRRQQGSTDLDTGSVTTLKRAFQEQSGKSLTEQQTQVAQNLHAKIKEQETTISELQKRLDEVHQAPTEKKSSKNYVKQRKDSFQAARDALKKLRTGESGLGVSIPLVRELAAIAPHIGNIVKSYIAEGIDRLGDIVDKIHEELSGDIPGLRRRDIHDLIAGDFKKENTKSLSVIDEKYGDLKKQARLVKKLEDLQNGLPEDFDKNQKNQSPEVTKLLEQIKKVKKDLHDMGYMKKPVDVKIPDTPEQKNIKRLEKRLEALQQGNYTYNDRREPSEREKELRDQIFEAKKTLGVIPSKQLSPEEESRIEQEKMAALAERFVNKKDNVFTADEAGAIWAHAKKIMEGGQTDFHDVVHQVAMDTGLTTEQVNRAIAQPKGAKVITDKMYTAMYKRNQVVQQAKIWVKSGDQSWQKKFWNKVIRIPSAITTALHGSVAPITHGGADLYRPSNWKSYFNFMLKSYQYSFGGVTNAGKAAYEKDMANLVRDPMYPMAKRAGLKIDPTDLSGDDYSKYQGIFGRLAKMGERGFNAMKPYRLEQFKKIYNGLSDQAKSNKDVLKTIADIANLSSGTTSINTGKYTDVAFFAPKLVTSQYQRIFSEPWKALSAAADWKNATTAQKLQAKMVARHAGEMMATYLAALAANQAILSMTGSKQKINFSNPLDPDWMRFKIAGKAVDASGGMNSSLRFVTSLVNEGLRANGVLKTDEKGKPGEEEGRKILQQAANKLSPLASDVAELFSTTDNSGNPLPWSSVKPSAGREKLTWPEYFESKAPIFVAEGFKAMNDAAKASGMPKATWNNYLEGAVIGALTGATGAKIAPDISKAKPGRGPRP